MRRIGIVNRGEPAVRFLTALDALRREDPSAPRAVALFTDADLDALFVRDADAAVRLGEGRVDYLDAEKVLDALRRGGCDAAWLGWGFASEDAAFARVLEDAGVTLLGPRSDTMAALGDKIRGKQLAESLDVPVAAWAIVEGVDAARAAAEDIGFPLLVKAAGGGGGRGIRRVDRAADLPGALRAAQDEADRSFGGGGLLLERLVDGARHVEVQILGDGEGAVRVLGLRDCSLQRRRQKVVEECPAPNLPAEREAALREAARRIGEAVRYRSAGTVEFLYDAAADRAYFLEVNTRLQVEHPVTEEVFGVDLVRAQIDLARGRGLPDATEARGWAIEARVCAEDPEAGFRPAPGRLVRFVLPAGPGVRVDTGFVEGDPVSPDFDPMLAKVIAWGPTRQAALARLARALEHTRVVVEGGTTNLAFLRALLARDDVRAGDVHVGLVDTLTLEPPRGAGAAVLAAATDRFLAGGDRTPAPGMDRHRVEAAGDVSVFRLGKDTFRVVSPDGAVTVAHQRDGPYQSWLQVGALRHRIERAPGDDTYVVDGVPHRVAKATGGAVAAPSAAMVLAVDVAVGDRVTAGQRLALLESMKMEVAVGAPQPGTVRAVRVNAGEQVAAGQVLVVLEAEGLAPDATPPPVIPWEGDQDDPQTAADRVRAAIIGWDHDPAQLVRDVERLRGADVRPLLVAFADLAELHERRARRQRDAGEGAAGAVSPALGIETLRRQGPAALEPAWREALERALRHHDVEDLEDEGVSDALLRIERAGHALPTLARAAEAALKALEPRGRPPLKLIDRLADLDPVRFAGVVEAAGRARYELFERPAYERLARASEARAEALIDALEAGEADWADLREAPESLMAGLSPRAAAGSEVAAQAVARRLEWHDDAEPVRRVEVAGRGAYSVGEGEASRLAVTCYAAEAPAVLAALRAGPPRARVDLAVVPAPGDDRDGPGLLDRLARALGLGGDAAPRVPFDELCVLAITGPGLPSVRRYRGMGREIQSRRDIMPSSEYRLDLGRLEHFRFHRLSADGEVTLFLAHGRENPDDVRLLAFGEIRSLERAPGSPLRLPHVERVFHEAVRAMQAAREVHDPDRRMQWNRIWLRIVPVVPLALETMKKYVTRLAPAGRRAGLEKVVVRARFVDKHVTGGVTQLMDLSIQDRAGQHLQLTLKPASHAPLMPLTRYETAVVAARRRGLMHPHEIVTMLEADEGLPPARFDEHDLDERGALVSVAGRGPGEHRAAVVVGVVRAETGAPEGLLTRVLVLSDPTRRMGALAEAECRRIVAAFDLAESLGVPLEWVAVSAGARIDWETGTENLDWTARVLARIVRFTQRGGEANVLVPGLCVGAQAYWNAEATMMMHTRGLLVMTDHGAMVLTGKRALDFSGCVSAEDDLALGGYTTIMGPNGQAQAWAPDLAAAYRLLYRYYDLTYAPPGQGRPARRATTDAAERDVGDSPYPEDLGHGFRTVGEVFSAQHNPDRKRPFAVRPVMAALSDADTEPVERWAAMHGAETAVVWESRVGGHAVTLVGIENQPVKRVGQVAADGPDQLAGGTLYPQASRKVARALNAASGRRPVVVLANLSGFDGSPESLGHWQLEYGAEIGRAVVNFEGPIVFVVLSRYHGGAYVVFSKTLNPGLTAVALEGSFASVIGGAPAAAVVFSGEVRRRARQRGDTPEARAAATSEVAAEFDAVHTVERAQRVGSIDAIIAPARLRPFVIEALGGEAADGD